MAQSPMVALCSRRWLSIELSNAGRWQDRVRVFLWSGDRRACNSSISCWGGGTGAGRSGRAAPAADPAPRAPAPGSESPAAAVPDAARALPAPASPSPRCGCESSRSPAVPSKSCTTREPAPVQHHAQGQERAVAALLLRAAPLSLRLRLGLALETRVGEIDEGDPRLLAEQSHRPREEARLQRLAIPQQQVAGTVEGAQAHCFEVAAQQPAKTAALAQPGPSGECRRPDWPCGRPARRERHGAGDRSGPVPAAGPAGRIARRPTARRAPRRCCGAAPAAANPRRRSGSWSGGPPSATARTVGRLVEQDSVPQQALGDALGLGLECRGCLAGQESGRMVEDLLDALAEGLPVRTPDREPGAEVKKGPLADLGADPPGADKPVGEVGLAAVRTDPDAADEHAPGASRKTGGVNPDCNFMALHFGFWDAPIESTICAYKGRNWDEMSHHLTNLVQVSDSLLGESK